MANQKNQDGLGYHSDRSNGNTIRQELWRIEDRLAKEISELSAELSEYVKSHERIHEIHRVWSEDQLEKVMDRFAQDELSRARKNGMFAVMLVAANIIGRYWAIILTILVALAAWTENINITIGN